MRFTWTPVLLALLLVPAFALPAFAEEEPAAPATEEPAPAPAPKPEPDPKVPVFSIEFLMPGEDDKLEGFKLRDRGAPDGSPTEDALTEMSEACKCSLDEDNFYVETAVLKAGGDKVGIAMVDVDKSVWAFRQKVNEAATQHGWKVIELGAKGRLLIVGPGSKQADACSALTEHVVYRLGRLGVDRISGRGGSQDVGRKAALEYSGAISNLAPGTGMAEALNGIVHWLKSQPKARGEKPDKAEQANAKAAWKKALADGAKYPPKGSILVFCAGQYGGMLLVEKKDAVLAEATRVLEIAVENEQDAKQNTQRFGNRYNLACAYARAKKIDEAIDMVRKSLEVGKNMPQQWYRQQFKHMEEKDPDMAPLRDDPRFSKLLSEFKPAPPPQRRGHPAPKKDEPKKDEPKKDG